jgi:hypothetical protein
MFEKDLRDVCVLLNQRKKQTPKMTSALDHAYISSWFTISVLRLRMLFIRPTHSIWSAAFSSSVTPSNAAICDMMR